MPHYSDGMPAELGDIVTGKGYNIKDEFGQLKDITGFVHNITPNAETCNIQILMLEPLNLEDVNEMVYDPKYAPHNLIVLAGKFYRIDIEYGQTDHFKRVG
jgi:hypothetical protein